MTEAGILQEVFTGERDPNDPEVLQLLRELKGMVEELLRRDDAKRSKPRSR